MARNLVALYAIAGALYGLGGVLEAARTGGATNNYGNMYELDAIAACVVGGVSTAGGIGTVPGVMAGVLIFGVINYGLTFIGVSPYWQLIIKGLIIVAAVAFDIRKYMARNKMSLKRLHGHSDDRTTFRSLLFPDFFDPFSKKGKIRE